MRHLWPGRSGDPQLTRFTDPKGPNGAEIAWRFLSRFHRSATGRAYGVT